MTERLLFRLAAPLAAWGEIAVGEIRSSWPDPSKSAVLGVVAAALGITREESRSHSALHQGLAFAVRVHEVAGSGKRSAPSRPLRDYHTAQSPSARRGARWQTRADELSSGTDLNTILSERWYWQQFSATAALSPLGSSAPPLEAIAEALRKPAFPLFLGRKSCPLARPLAPRIMLAKELAAAFRAYDQEDAEKWLQLTDSDHDRPAAPVLGRSVWRDAEPGEIPRRHRRDAVRDRRVWTFDERGEVCVTLDDAGGA